MVTSSQRRGTYRRANHIVARYWKKASALTFSLDLTRRVFLMDNRDGVMVEQLDGFAYTYARRLCLRLAFASSFKGDAGVS